MSPFASAEEPAILLLEPIEPSGRLDLQGEETQRLEALSRLGRSELSTAALRWRVLCEYFQKHAFWSWPQYARGRCQVSHACLYSEHMNEKRAGVLPRGYTTCDALTSFLPGKRCSKMLIRSLTPDL